MHTPAGEIKITVNGREVPYESARLDAHASNFDVDGRYLLTCDVPGGASGEHVVECFVQSEVDIDDEISGAYTDERLAQVSMWWGPDDMYNLSIGTEGDIPGVTYEYFSDGMAMTRRDDPGRIAFAVAWIELDGNRSDNRYDRQTQMAADLLPWERIEL